MHVCACVCVYVSPAVSFAVCATRVDAVNRYLEAFCWGTEGVVLAP